MSLLVKKFKDFSSLFVIIVIVVGTFQKNSLEHEKIQISIKRIEVYIWRELR